VRQRSAGHAPSASATGLGFSLVELVVTLAVIACWLGLACASGGESLVQGNPGVGESALGSRASSVARSFEARKQAGGKPVDSPSRSRAGKPPQGRSFEALSRTRMMELGEGWRAPRWDVLHNRQRCLRFSSKWPGA